MHVCFCGVRFSFFSTISASKLQHCVGVHGHGEDQRAKVCGQNGRRAKLESRGVEFLGRGCSPSHQLLAMGNAVRYPSWVRGEAPVTWRFGTFYRLIKLLLVSILLILNLFP